MPTYTYECKKCGEEQDVFHPMNATPRVRCVSCGGVCKRLLGMGAGVIFKGSGFYETDYKTKRGDKASKSGKGNGKASPDASKGDAASKSESTASSDKASSETASSKTTSSKKDA